MTSSARETAAPWATSVRVSEDALTVDLDDGRSIAVPLGWYPRLAHATPEERGRWRLMGAGRGIRWEELDEDVSVAALLAGRPSGESQDSLRRWLECRGSRTAED
ncbi:MAG: DUF2442 domain-containing protein [Armatimonadetes bacterium]|nr:DUF2442 domain-containing protein [Armatimonadota bacterium]